MSKAKSPRGSRSAPKPRAAKGKAAGAAHAARGSSDREAVDRQQQLCQEVSAWLPTFAVMRSQLADVMRHVEQSVVEVCGSFQEIAYRARTAVRPTGTSQELAAEQVDAPPAMMELMTTARGTIGGLLASLEVADQTSTDAAQRITRIEERLSQVIRAVQVFGRVATDAHMLALNGKIEAARAGRHGSMFGVVALETAKLAEHARQTSMQVRDLVELLGSDFTQTSDQLRKQASVQSEQTRQCREHVDATFGAMEQASERLQAEVVQSQQHAQGLASEISRAVMALQFQDAVHQRVDHIIKVLEEVEAALRSRLPDAPAEGGELSSPADGDHALRLAGLYTMDRERQLMDQVLGTSAAAGDLGDNVELF